MVSNKPMEMPPEWFISKNTSVRQFIGAEFKSVKRKGTAINLA